MQRSLNVSVSIARVQNADIRDSAAHVTAYYNQSEIKNRKKKPNEKYDVPDPMMPGK